jgi:hypothetical protein
MKGSIFGLNEEEWQEGGKRLLRSELKPMFYSEIPESVTKVDTIKIGNAAIKVVCDSTIPDNEIHFISNGKCAAKFINGSI